MKNKKEYIVILVGGIIIGTAAGLLVLFGNPKNMGFCIACFIRDTVGAMGLHGAESVQYIRPEVAALVLGAFASSLIGREFLPRGGSSPLTRFILGFFVMVGCLMFMGCPFRMVLRMAGGDINALFGFAGFILGILAGVFFLSKGYSLGRTYSLGKTEGGIFSAVQLVLIVLLVSAPSLIRFSQQGPGASHAPVVISIAAGLIAGVIAQRTRLCMAGGIRDIVLFKDFKLIIGFGAIFASALAVNLITGNFALSMEGQPAAHGDVLWNLLGMLLCGFGCVLLGGCPLRQLVLAGEGNSDSAITVLGLGAGAAFAHNFSLASSADGPTANGKAAVIIGIAVVALIAVMNTKKAKR